MIVGPSLSEISAAYVVLTENIILETNTCTSAVELCIQCVKTLHRNYSRISDHVWHAIESLGFNIALEHEGDDLTRALNSIRKD